MKTIGVICEYNPFHNGHQHQLDWIRSRCGQDCVIVCLMSGNFVQRGAPAIVDKSIRAHAAVLSGADLVLELPVSVSLSSAEGFAAGGVRLLSQFCDGLCFGTESMTEEALYKTAQALLSPELSRYLKEELAKGCSFPSARQAALSRMGVTTDLHSPNDILAVEYTKAILSQHSPMVILPVPREGCYHDDHLNPNAPSATAVRKALLCGSGWESAVPEPTVSLLKSAPLHTLQAGERAILARLRSMEEGAYEQLPYGSEGLWRKLRKAAQTQNDLVSIIDATKSKRYTRTRIDRMLLCAFLGLTQTDMGVLPQKLRVLAFTDQGRGVLRNRDCFLNAGEAVEESERRIGSLYGLFGIKEPDPPNMEDKRRIIYHQE